MKIGIFAAIGVVVLVIIACFVSYVSMHNYGNAQEKLLEAKWSDNQNILGQYSIKIGELVQVPEMYKSDLKEVIQANFEGRYGPDGSKAVFQWFREQNLNLDAEQYRLVQREIAAGRQNFTVAQTELLDIKRGYETALGSFWQGFWLKVAGYPKVDLAKYRVVVAGNTAEVFAAGVDTGLQLRAPAPATTEPAAQPATIDQQ